MKSRLIAVVINRRFIYGRFNSASLSPFTGENSPLADRDHPSRNIDRSLTLQLVQLLCKLANQHRAKWQTCRAACAINRLAHGVALQKRSGIVQDRRVSWIWRSLGETKGNYRKAGKTGTNQLGCLVIATTFCYHRQRSSAARRLDRRGGLIY
ncbi:hypothetical protein AB7M71_000724 [Bradyrhizobium japonicum]|jgi:hypothetical protein